MGQHKRKLLIYVPTIHENRYDYFVDSVGGNDANTGKKHTDAFASIAKLLTVLQPGQKIGLARDSVWREQLTIAANNISVAAYGVGNAPILRCDEIATAGMWTKTVGQTNVYQMTPTVDYLVGYGGFQSIWEDDVRLPLAADLATCDSTPGSYYVASHTTTTPTIYVHATGSGNPAANSKVYEYAKRNFGFVSDGYTGISITGIDCRRNLSESGSIRVGRSSTITNCYAREGNKHNIYYEDGCTLSGVQALDCYYNGSATLFVYNENTPAGLGITHTDCIANADSDGSAFVGGTSGFYGHKNTSGTFGTITYNGCNVINCYAGYEGTDANLVLNNCSTDVSVANGVRPWTSMTLTNCTINAKERAISGDIAAGVTITATGCTFVVPSATVNAGLIYTQYTAAFVFNGCTFTVTGGSFYIMYMNAANVSLTVQNCTFTTAANNVWRFLSSGWTISSDYNSFKATSGFRLEGNTYTFAQWQALGYDVHSTHV